MQQTKYYIPYQFIDWSRRISQGVERNELIEDTNLISFSKGSIDVEIILTVLIDDQRDTLEDVFSIPTCPFQLAAKVDFEYGPTGLDSYLEVRKEVKKYLFFSFILSNREVKTYYHPNNDWYHDDFEKEGEGGQGIILPYSFLEISDGGDQNVNYQSDYHSLLLRNRGRGWFTRFSPPKVSQLETLLEEFLVNNNRALDESVVDLMIRSHTISSVGRGQFFMNIISMFSCFDELLGQSVRAGTFGNEDLLERFQFFRHAIAHPDTHRIRKRGNKYVATKYADSQGNSLPSPEQKKFDIDDLEEVRVRLIDEVLNEIGV